MSSATSNGDLVRATGVLEQTSWRKRAKPSTASPSPATRSAAWPKGPGATRPRWRTGSITVPRTRDRRRHPVLTEARGGESLPCDPAAATNPAPLRALHCRLPHWRPSRRRNGGSRRRPQSPRPRMRRPLSRGARFRALDCSDLLPRFASWRGVPIGLDFLRNISLAIYKEPIDRGHFSSPPALPTRRA